MMFSSRYSIRTALLALLITVSSPMAWVAQTGAQELVSIAQTGASGNGSSMIRALELGEWSYINRSGMLSADGSAIVFTSRAGNLTTIADTNGGIVRACTGVGCTQDVFVRNRALGQTTLVTVNLDGNDSGSGQFSGDATISADGNHVVFVSAATNLVPGGTSPRGNVFVRDLVANRTVLISVNVTGTDGGNQFSLQPVISANGRFVAFMSASSDLVANDTNFPLTDIFVRDRDRDEDGIYDEPDPLATRLVSATREGNSVDGASRDPVISASGQVIAFVSEASDLPLYGDIVFGRDINGASDVFVWDRLTGLTTRVSGNLAGFDSGNGPSDYPALSANGLWVAFESDASDFAANDSNDARDVFAWSRSTGLTSLVSVNRTGTSSGNGASGQALGRPAISEDGEFIAFTSQASDLATTNDTNDVEDVYIRDQRLNRTSLISANLGRTDSGNDLSSDPVISADGRFVAFISFASDLHVNDVDRTQDVFVRDFLVSDRTKLISRGADASNHASGSPAISANGEFVAFESLAQDLSVQDTNGVMDIYVTSVPDLNDSDGDGIGDDTDNCILVPNAAQRDSNEDGYGNACDADLNDDCIVNVIDLGLFKSVFFTTDPDADLNGDGVVSVLDLGRFKLLYFKPPGPSGLTAVCDGSETAL